VNTVAVADNAITVWWSLRFMANVLRWVTGVVCNYNTTTRFVKRELTQLKA
jgi:hypothetical protein